MAILFASLATAGAALACSYTTPIEVDARLGIPRLHNWIWDEAERKQTEKDLRLQLVGEMANLFPYWCYQPGDQAGHYSLIFELLQENREVHLRVSFEDDGRRLGERQSLLWKAHQRSGPAELENSSRAERVEFFRESLANHLLRPSAPQNYLLELLKDNVPVTYTGEWRVKDRAVPSVVLPLPWKGRFEKVYFSKFQLDCHKKGSGWQEIEAIGSPEAARYPVEPENRPDAYEALEVLPRSSKAYPEDLTDYEPMKVMLRQIESAAAARMLIARGARP